jgi:site-specific DNA-cytosine methylase
MEWKKPSPTLTCKCVSISNGRFGHPTQLRGISLKEAALLQSFPDNYEFYGKFRNMAMQIGNAVPPLWMRYVVKSSRFDTRNDARFRELYKKCVRRKEKLTIA